MKEMKRMHRFLTIVLLIVSLAACARVTATLTSEGQTPLPEIELEAVLQVPDLLHSGESVMLTFTLINHSDTSLYVLKWYTPLEGLMGEIFDIERDGQAIPYEGILATRDTPPPEAYVLLESGASVSAEVDLANAYDFSQAGEYRIGFRSPSISCVARTEADMAKTVDDLGPVSISSSPVYVTIASASESFIRRTPAQAAAVIRTYLQNRKPDLDPALQLATIESPVQEAWERMRVQVFRVIDGPFINESILIRGDAVLHLGDATGGTGVTSLLISDLDRDDSPELLFTYSFGSGLHQSRIGMYAPAFGQDRVYEAGTAYLGDVGLFKADMANVGVRVIVLDETASILRELDTLGHLDIEQREEQTRLVLRVARNLGDDLRQNLVTIPEPSEPEDKTPTAPPVPREDGGTDMPHLTVDELAVVAALADGPGHLEYTDRIGADVLDRLHARADEGELARNNDALASFDYRLTAHFDPEWDRTFYDVYRGQEREPLLSRLSHVWPVSVSASGSDFFFAAENAPNASPQYLLVSNDEVEEWNAEASALLSPVYVGEALGCITCSGFPTLTCEVTLNGQVVYTQTAIAAGASIPLRSFTSWDGHWALEVDDQLIIDGQDVGQARGYDVVFGFALIRGLPLYFFEQDGSVYISYDGQTMPNVYDEVFHDQCCEAAVHNVGAGEDVVWFHALRNGTWHFVVISSADPNSIP
jgi:hypothetical protein